MNRDEERLRDILDAIDAIEQRRPKDRKSFDADEVVQVWIIRHLSIMGEAASRLTVSMRHRAPEIPWKRMIGMRNVLVHDYLGIKLDIVWKVVVEDLEPVRRSIIQLLQESS